MSPILKRDNRDSQLVIGSPNSTVRQKMEFDTDSTTPMKYLGGKHVRMERPKLTPIDQQNLEGEQEENEEDNMDDSIERDDNEADNSEHKGN